MRIASLHIHPVKGMRAADLSAAAVERHGLQHDRRWLVTNADGTFLTQRDYPALATVEASPTGTGLRLSVAGQDAIEVTQPDGMNRLAVTIWGTDVDAAAADARADEWLSDFLQTDARLVFMDRDASRLKDSEWTDEPVPVSFADAFPILVTTIGSLEAVNRDIEAHNGTAVPMARFRPNIVIEGADDWAEDHWTRLAVGEVTLDLVKPCDRCIVTTTDQTTGKRNGKQPLASLARLRQSKDPRIKGVLFGVNAVPRTLGVVYVGDSVRVLE